MQQQNCLFTQKDTMVTIVSTNNEADNMVNIVNISNGQRYEKMVGKKKKKREREQKREINGLMD